MNKLRINDVEEGVKYTIHIELKSFASPFCTSNFDLLSNSMNPRLICVFPFRNAVELIPLFYEIWVTLGNEQSQTCFIVIL